MQLDQKSEKENQIVNEVTDLGIVTNTQVSSGKIKRNLHKRIKKIKEQCLLALELETDVNESQFTGLDLPLSYRDHIEITGTGPLKLYNTENKFTQNDNLLQERTHESEQEDSQKISARINATNIIENLPDDCDIDLLEITDQMRQKRMQS